MIQPRFFVFAAALQALLVCSMVSDFFQIASGVLSPGELAAINVLAKNGTFEAAAEAGSMTVRQLFNDRQKPEFQTALALAVEEEQRRVEAEDEADSRLVRDLAVGGLAGLKRLAVSDPVGYEKFATSKIAPANAEKLTKMLDRSVRGRRVAKRMATGDGPGVVVNNQASASATAQAAALAAAQASAPIPFSPDMRGFVERDLGPGAMPVESLYPRVEWILGQCDRPDVRTVVLRMGKGAGKGIVLAAYLARRLQRLLSMPDAGLHYKLMPGVKVGVLNLSVTGNQAQLAVFDDLGRIVRNSEWFKKFAPKILADKIEFEGQNVIAFCGNSSSKGVEGVAWLAAGADEVSRLPEDEHNGPVQARDLVEPVEATMLTRFAADRKMLIASWPEHRDDYVSRRIEAARKAGVRADLTTEFRALPIVRSDGKDEARRNEAVADDTARKARIAAAPFAEFQSEVFLSVDGTLCVTAPTWEVKPDADLEAFAGSLDLNKVQAARMLGARPLSVGEHPFFRDIDEFVRRATARPHPVGEDGRFFEWFKGKPDEWYFGHIDLGLRHDAAGIAVAHYDGGKVVYDLLLEVKPPTGGELRISALLEVFSDMRRRGFEFMKVTRDGWQGIAVGQDLEDMGVPTEEFSVDRNRAAYDTFKNAWVANQLDYYVSEPLFECVKSLVDMRKKVDHTPGGKKDLSDAAAAVCFHALESVM